MDRRGSGRSRTTYLNLRQVIGKFVGEMEGTLSSLFFRVGETDVNLIFHEAESLFGKCWVSSRLTSRLRSGSSVGGTVRSGR
jgi:hypothetical protein